MLGYYFRGRKSATDIEKYNQHALWIIQHLPTDPLARELCIYSRFNSAAAHEHGKTIWLKHCELHPTDPVILRHAANYFLLEERSTAEKLLLAGKALQPKNPDWCERLAHLYSLGVSELSDLENAEKALSEQERAVTLTKASDKFYLQIDLPALAFKAGQVEKASRYANHILRHMPRSLADDQKSDAKHSAHAVLGRIALLAGAIESAKSHLRASAEVPGSNSLNISGPDFALAREMLEKNEREAVLAFLERCEVFWQNENGRLAKWRAEIVSSVVPDDWKDL